LAKHAQKVIILDHHKTALDQFPEGKSSPLPNLEVNIDMNRSGATMAWDYFKALHDQSSETPFAPNLDKM
jgi:oligoribonuclease NrnB/cAMP/cGMP phosphodiesterase (DHH superfamily)